MQPRPAEDARKMVSCLPAWRHLREHTPARIALGRCGGSLSTPEVLDFRLSHARAKDAVHAVFDPARLAAEFSALGLETFLLRTEVGSRMEYLARPDLGRRLSQESREALCREQGRWGRRDLAIMISDGLSALAAHRHAAETAASLHRCLSELGWTLYPVLLVPFARVKLQDEVGSLLGAGFSVMLLGERPGLGAPDSLGAYFTYQPGPGKTDADRNCLSNIRAEGMPPREAGRKLAALLVKAAMLQTTGVALKDEGETLSAPPASLPDGSKPHHPAPG